MLDVQNLTRSSFPYTIETLEKGMEQGVAPGAVLGLWDVREPDKAYEVAVGSRRVEPTSQLMHPEVYFDLASLSKVLATTPLTAFLVQRGWLSWETPVKKVLPEFAHSAIRVRHLLAHTAGLPAWFPFWERLKDRFSSQPLWQVPVQDRQEEAFNQMGEIEPEEQPDQVTCYSDVTFILLGLLLEKILQMPLDKAVRHLVWAPLGIKHAFYHRVELPPSEDYRLDVAATEHSEWRGGILQGQVHDDNAWAMGGYAGHAGAFARVDAVLQFARSLFGRSFSPEVLKAMLTPVPWPQGCERTLGWDTPSQGSSSAGRYFSSYSIGHLGFTGTSLWIDLTKGLAICLLTNRVHPSRENEKIKDFRPHLHDAVRFDLNHHSN